MKMGIVIGQVVSTLRHPALAGKKLMLIQPVDPKFRPVGDPVVALDTMNAGIGETVLVVEEGRAARQVLNVRRAPVRTLILGIVDEVEMNNISRRPPGAEPEA
jgi:ethanolamine utilization protein EutN